MKTPNANRRAATVLAIALLVYGLEAPLVHAAGSTPAGELMDSMAISWPTLVIAGIGAGATLTILQWRRRRNNGDQ